MRVSQGEAGNLQASQYWLPACERPGFLNDAGKAGPLRAPVSGVRVSFRQIGTMKPNEQVERMAEPSYGARSIHP